MIPYRNLQNLGSSFSAALQIYFLLFLFGSVFLLASSDAAQSADGVYILYA